jgi:hypothetical protein
MRKIILLLTLSAAAAWSADEVAPPAEATPETGAATAAPAADAGTAPAAEATPEYVEREENAVSPLTGKRYRERVIEFSAVEVNAELARPVEIIIPRARPDFDKITLTIYNNEPSALAPEEYKLEYYRRVPVREEAAEAGTRAAFAPEAAATPPETPATAEPEDAGAGE